jgi:23S rRNA pseudouridine2605 synthase
VKLNGRPVTELGTRATAADHVLVDGKTVTPRRELLYVLLHKPAGVVTTLSDPESRPTVRTLLPRALPRVFPVGRLDVQSTGLVLLTNDGELAARLMHPRHHIARTYRVKVRGRPDPKALSRLRRGMRLEDGPTGAAEVEIERELPTKTWLRIVVHEGRSHLVRRMCHAIGHGAEKLQRVALGPLALGRLHIGDARMLTSHESAALRRAVGLERGAPSVRGRKAERRPRRPSGPPGPRVARPTP